MKIMTVLLGFVLLLGVLAVDVHAQTPAPPAPPAQQEAAPQQAPGATDKGTAPQATTPETRGAPAAQPPNVTIDSRSEQRQTGDGERGKILGVDPTVAMVFGAVLLVVVVIALVAMSKRSEDVPTHRSV